MTELYREMTIEEMAREFGYNTMADVIVESGDCENETEVNSELYYPECNCEDGVILTMYAFYVADDHIFKTYWACNEIDKSAAEYADLIDDVEAWFED